MGQLYVKPQSTQVMSLFAPRRFRKSMLCSPRSRFSDISERSLSLMLLPLPRRSSRFISTISTLGMDCSLKRRDSVK